MPHGNCCLRNNDSADQKTAACNWTASSHLNPERPASNLRAHLLKRDTGLQPHCCSVSSGRGQFISPASGLYSITSSPSHVLGARRDLAAAGAAGGCIWLPAAALPCPAPEQHCCSAPAAAAGASAADLCSQLGGLRGGRSPHASCRRT
jgi:hypothetical protein